MKIAAVICNFVLFAFTCMVLLTDGLPTQAAYIVFNVWLLLTLILNVVVISRIGPNDGRLWLQLPRTTADEQGEAVGGPSTSAFVRVAVALCNVVLLGFTGWAYVDQYPHPEEPGLTTFTLLLALTPIQSLVVAPLLRIVRPLILNLPGAVALLLCMTRRHRCHVALYRVPGLRLDRYRRHRPP